MSQEGPRGIPTPESNAENLNTDNVTEINAGSRIAVEAGTEDISDSEIPFAVAEQLNDSNRNIFEKMSHKGRDIASRAYEGLYKVPVVNRLVGKMEIAYNQFWADHHENKAIKFKEKTDGVDIQLGTFDQATKQIELTIEGLKQQKMPGAESLQVQLRDIENQRRGLLDKKDKYQSKFEKRDNKLQLYTNERDRVADKLIDYYDERMAPMEKELGNLETCRDRVDLVVAVTEARHKDEKTRLSGVEKRKVQIEEILRSIGRSEKEIKKFEAVKALDKIIADGREKMKKEMASLARRKAEINKTVAKVDKKANPYRDKREKFIRIKQGRPVEMNMSARQKGVNNKFEEKTKGYTRAEGEEPPSGKFEEVPEPAEEEESNETAENFEVSRYVSDWNAVLKDKYKNDASKEMVDVKDFIKMTGLAGSYKLEPSDFMKIMGRYYKLKKMPTGKLNAEADSFVEMLGIVRNKI